MEELMFKCILPMTESIKFFVKLILKKVKTRNIGSTLMWVLIIMMSLKSKVMFLIKKDIEKRKVLTLIIWAHYQKEQEFLTSNYQKGNFGLSLVYIDNDIDFVFIYYELH